MSELRTWNNRESRCIQALRHMTLPPAPTLGMGRYADVLERARTVTRLHAETRQENIVRPSTAKTVAMTMIVIRL